MNELYIYKETTIDGIEIYEKKIFDLDNFEIIEKDNQIIVKKKIKTIEIKTIEDFDMSLNFRHSKIISCFINDKRPSNNKYLSIVKDIYNIIGSGKNVIKKTKLNFETFEKNDKGFHYLQNLGISFQGRKALNMFEEILNQCLENNIKLNVEIKFSNNEIIFYVINN